MLTSALLPLGTGARVAQSNPIFSSQTIRSKSCNGIPPRNCIAAAEDDHNGPQNKKLPRSNLFAANVCRTGITYDDRNPNR